MSAHADTRGTNAFNSSIAKRKLKMMKSYLYSKNVRKNQISGEAYGEIKTVNKCMNDIPCNESDHKKNRRVNYIFFRDTINDSSNIKN